MLSPAQNYLRGVVDLALTLDPKPATVAVLSADDPFSVEVADAAKTYAEQKGLQVVYYQKYPNASTDLRAPLTETKAQEPRPVPQQRPPAGERGDHAAGQGARLQPEGLRLQRRPVDARLPDAP